MFKLIGFVAGYCLFGFFDAMYGRFIGSFFDRMVTHGIGAIYLMQNALCQAVFLETVFNSIGKLAKADGDVSQHEIDQNKSMQKLGMTPEHRRQAKEIHLAHDLIKQHRNI